MVCDRQDLPGINSAKPTVDSMGCDFVSVSAYVALWTERQFLLALRPCPEYTVRSGAAVSPTPRVLPCRGSTRHDNLFYEHMVDENLVRGGID
jgi:hypothetical protein